MQGTEWIPHLLQLSQLDVDLMFFYFDGLSPNGHNIFTFLGQILLIWMRLNGSDNELGCIDHAGGNFFCFLINIRRKSLDVG